MKSQATPVLIYGLVSSNEPNKICYIGKTKQNIKKRIHDHIRESNKLKTKKDFWIQSVLNDKYEILVKIIESCNDNNWFERERYWISKTPNLTNISKGGDGGRGLKAVLQYNELKEFAHKNMLHVKNSIEWVKFVKENQNFNFIPKYPYASYKNRGWVSWADLLLNYRGSLSGKRNAFKPFFKYWESKEKLKKIGIKNKKEYKQRVKEIEVGIPTNPDVYYKRDGTWISWGDFLSTKSKYHKNKPFLSYNEAKKFLKQYLLKSGNEYRGFIKTLKISLPYEPDRFYKRRKEWINWSDFLSK